MTKKPASGHTRKQAGTAKHKSTAKHHPAAQKKTGATAHGTKVHTVAKHPSHAKARGLALGDAIACCAAEALAASARLLGHPVTEAAVLELHRLAGGDDVKGAEVLAVLEAAAQHGLAGLRLASFSPAEASGDPLGWGDERRHHLVELGDAASYGSDNGRELVPGHGLILGLELPGGPHTITLDPSGLAWSWGELYDLDELGAGPAEEAWAVTWA